MSTSMIFEIWFYRGLIGIMLVIVWWLVQRWINNQEKKNEKFFDLLDEHQQAITRLNAILESKEKMCNERHKNIDRKLELIEDKI